MARVSVEGDEVVVRLGPRERMAARRRSAVRVPAAALRRAHVEADWWRVLRGEAGRGRWRPGRCAGIRRTTEGEDFVAVRAGGPVLCMDLDAGSPFAHVAVTVADPGAVGRRLRAALPADDGPGDGADPPVPHVPLPVAQEGAGPVGGGARGSALGVRQPPPPDEERVRRANADRVRRDHVLPGAAGARLPRPPAVSSRTWGSDEEAEP
ncbi:hypothetical protein ACIPRL_29135 [Streptomyces sp. NPDC090085]|uniref:hypothetical protein n=1 Tax=unclassified Streptomyces TaxID=2593676 RepID=UPI0037FAD2E2